MAVKTCVRCGTAKPLEDFHKRSAATDGRNSACKTCICAERARYRAANRDWLNKQTRDWRAANPGRQAELSRDWRVRNPERMRDYAREYADANPETVAAAKRRWYLENRDYVLAWPQRNAESSRARFKRYRQSNAEVRAEAARLRRALKAGVEASEVDLDVLWTGTCGICGGEMDRELRWPDPWSKSVDHIVPIAKGGGHTQDNLQWAHVRCNISKGASLPSEVA